MSMEASFNHKSFATFGECSLLNLLLTELDGVEALTGVFVFAATSQPDLLDAALLRPGRLDRLLFCDFPTWRERWDILTVLSKKLPLSNDVHLETIASMTEGFSGADLQALLSDAQLKSVHELLNNGYVSGENSRKMPVISDRLLKSVTSKARPLVSEHEKRRLNGIYSQFLDAKKQRNHFWIVRSILRRIQSLCFRQLKVLSNMY